jgi:hypothetical protein
MATTLQSDGIKFPDDTVQTTKALGMSKVTSSTTFATSWTQYQSYGQPTNYNLNGRSGSIVMGTDTLTPLAACNTNGGTTYSIYLNYGASNPALTPVVTITPGTNSAIGRSTNAYPAVSRQMLGKYSLAVSGCTSFSGTPCGNLATYCKNRNWNFKSTVAWCYLV